MDNNFLFLCVLQVTLANESIVLYMCEGKVLMDNYVICSLIYICISICIMCICSFCILVCL